MKMRTRGDRGMVIMHGRDISGTCAYGGCGFWQQTTGTNETKEAVNIIPIDGITAKTT